MRLSAIPRGFLDLLGVSRDGRTLTEANDALQAVLDATPMYLASEQQLGGQGTAVGAGFTAFATVPLGEIWYLHSAHADIDQPVGESGVGALCEQSPNSGGNERVLLTPYLGSVAVVAGTAVRQAQPWVSRAGYCLIAGSQLGIFTPAAPSGGTAFRVGFKVTKLRTGA